MRNINSELTETLFHKQYVVSRSQNGDNS